MPDQTPPDVEAIRAELAAMAGRPWTAEAAEYFIGRLLDENARLNAENERIRATTKLHRESTARQRHNLEQKLIGWREAAEEARAELDKVIREAAVDKAKAEELARENRVLRLEPSNARFDEVVAEKNQATDDWYEAAKARDELACKVEAVRRTINPRSPGWKPLSERYPEYFEPDSTEEAARKKGWRQGVDLLTQRIKAALDDPAAAPEMPSAFDGAPPIRTNVDGSQSYGPYAAPEMPRPPAEEGRFGITATQHDPSRAYDHKVAEPEPDLTLIPAELIVRDPEVCSGRPTMRGTRLLAEMVAGHLAAGTTWEELHQWYPWMPIPTAQEPVSGPETAGTGSGRGTGDTEAPGAAQDGEEA